MTNATVSGITAAPQGQVLKVTYKGGEAEVIVAPDTPIVTYVPGSAANLTFAGPSRRRWVSILTGDRGCEPIPSTSESCRGSVLDADSSASACASIPFR
jgi:hypothetical protein